MTFLPALFLLYFLSNQKSLGQTANDIITIPAGTTSPPPATDGGAGIQLIGDSGSQPLGIIPPLDGGSQGAQPIQPQPQPLQPQSQPYQPQQQPLQPQPQAYQPQQQPYQPQQQPYQPQQLPYQPVLQPVQQQVRPLPSDPYTGFGSNQQPYGTFGNDGSQDGPGMTSPACYEGQQQPRGNFILQCRNGNFEFAFCVLRGKRIPMEGKHDDGNFIWACSQPNLGRVELKAVACSYKGRQIQPGQTFPNGRMLMKCVVESGGVIRTDVVGCVGDDGREAYSMGVVLFHGKPYRCIASGDRFDMVKIE